MSNAAPRQGSITYVKVRTYAHARIKTTALFRTGTKDAVATAGATGLASLGYRIPSGNAGFRVDVDADVPAGGSVRFVYCYTSFTPHR